MVVNRTYEDVMDEKNLNNFKKRLGEDQSTKAKKDLTDYALNYHKDIVEILDLVPSELLLIFKTNNYLRAID